MSEHERERRLSASIPPPIERPPGDPLDDERPRLLPRGSNGPYRDMNVSLRKIPTYKSFATVKKATLKNNYLELAIDTSSLVQATVHIDGKENIDVKSGITSISSIAKRDETIMVGIGQTKAIGPLVKRQPTPPEGGFSVVLELKSVDNFKEDAITHMYYYGTVSFDGVVTWTTERISFGGPVHTAQALYGSPKPVLTDGDECVICLTNPKEVVILHCRHVCLCKACATITSSTWSYQCPVCRGRVSAMCALADADYDDGIAD